MFLSPWFRDRQQICLVIRLWRHRRLRLRRRSRRRLLHTPDVRFRRLASSVFRRLESGFFLLWLFLARNNRLVIFSHLFQLRLDTSRIERSVYVTNFRSTSTGIPVANLTRISVSNLSGNSRRRAGTRCVPALIAGVTERERSGISP